MKFNEIKRNITDSKKEQKDLIFKFSIKIIKLPKKLFQKSFKYLLHHAYQLKKI